MDFNNLNSVAAAEKGADLHLCHPATGAKLYDNADNPFEDNGKPCIVTVLGSEAPAVRKSLRSVQKARAKAEPEQDGKDDDDVSLDELHEQLVAGAKVLITGFKNINNGKKAAKAPEDIDWFLGLNRVNLQENESSFAEQVNAFAAKRGNFLGNASDG